MLTQVISISYVSRVSSPGVAEFIGFAAQAKLVRFENDISIRSPQTPTFGSNPGDVTEMQGIGI